MTQDAADLNRSTLCAICQCGLGAEPITECPACRARYHSECWEENQGCAVYGCPQVPATEHRGTLEIPASYWGTENKQCPQCHREILAAAVRCRYCGATFSTSRPQDQNEFQERARRTERVPALRRTIVWLFILCAIPVVSMFAAIVGLVWYGKNRDSVRSLPALYSGLCKIALGLGVGQSVLMVIMVLLYSTFHGG